MNLRDRLTGHTQSHRGLSETVSFLLLFAILLSVSITGAVFGIDSLETASQGRNDMSAYRSLEAVRGDLYDLTAGATYRTTDLRISEGSLRYGRPISITFTATDGTETMEPVSIRTVPIVADAGSSEFRLLSGAILIHQTDGGIVRIGPRLRIDEEQSIIPLLNTTPGEGPVSVGGSGNIAVVSYRDRERVRRFEPVDEAGSSTLATVRITLQTPRPSVWHQFFVADNRFENAVIDEHLGTVSAEFRTRRLSIKATDVEIRFDD